MTNDKITYGESIECPGRWRRMDYETTVKDGETDFEAGVRAEKFVQNFLSKEQASIAPFGNQNQNDNFIQSLRKPEEKITPEQGKSNTIQSIQQCKTLTDLQTWQMLTILSPEIKQAYNEKLSQLS